MDGTENQNEQECVRDEAVAIEMDFEQALQTAKREKRNAKSALTRFISQLMCRLADETVEKWEIIALLDRIEQQKDEVFIVLDRMEEIYTRTGDKVNAAKVVDEGEVINDQVSNETFIARKYLSTLVLNVVQANTRSTPKASETELTDKNQMALGHAAVNPEGLECLAPKRIELEDEEPGSPRSNIEQSLNEFIGEQCEIFNAPEEKNAKNEKNDRNVSSNRCVELNETGSRDDEHNYTLKEKNVQNVRRDLPPKEHTSRETYSQDEKSVFQDKRRREPNSQLERIRIPKFEGNKLEFQQWYTAFISCVDETAMTAQFKMLRLEACLGGEAAETIKGLGYTQVAYDAAKKRLVRKYGGNRRQIQSHLDELKRMKPLKEDDVKELEKFADTLERAVINLQENGRKSELEAGTLYTILLEKIPGKLLSLYYRWLRENKEFESLETLKNWVAEEAEIQMQAAEIKHGLQAKNEGKQDDRERWKEGRRSRSYGTNRADNQGKERLCKVCGEKHPIWTCQVYKSRTVDKRWEIAKRYGLCYRCLGDDHLGNRCPRNRVCGISGCNDTHHRLLHGTEKRKTESQSPGNGRKQNESVERNTERGNGTEGENNNQNATHETFQANETKRVALRTIPIVLKNGNKRVLVNCFLDDGSDTTYINEDVVEELGLQGKKEKITVNVANGQQVSFDSMTFTIGLESTDGHIDTTIEAKTSERICGGMKPVNWVKIQHQWKHLRDVPFPELGSRGVIDVLFGTDNYHLMYSMQEVLGKGNEPCARLCPLGWTAVGPIRTTYDGEERTTRFHYTYRASFAEEPRITSQTGEDLNALVKKFWDLEAIGILPPSAEPVARSPDEKLAMKKVTESLKFDGEYYEVAVPWKGDRPNLTNNRSQAEQRLYSTEQKLQKNNDVKKAYQNVIDEYLQKGYIRRVPDDEPKPKSEWLLPHFPVIRPERSTTKVRIVFDASAQVKGKSLNSEALAGPKLQANLVDILVKFRKELIPLVGDISQMYHQLKLREEDRPFHRFLWRDLDTKKKPEIYEFLRFVFGGCYCPFCVQYVWQNHGERNKNEFPLAAEAVKKNCYMDDLMPSVKDVETAKKMRNELTSLGDKAGFHIRKWISSKPEVLEDIPESDRASEIDLQKNELPITKTLGVLWSAKDDTFSFIYSSPPSHFKLTKRNVLKKTATVFDPLGFLVPFIIRAKILLQQAWLQAIAWDDELPESLKTKWEQWFKELAELQQIKVPRCLKESASVILKINLHTFTDASQKAYTATVYARHEYEDGTVSCRLITSKTRLAPLKAMSIPRLELMGAVIGVRLTRQVCESMEIEAKSITYWTDSLNVGYWIKGHSRQYKTFVAHRIGEIHESTDPQQWRYVPTKLNPADRGTRGLTVHELKNDKCWWQGPEFLKHPESEWPERKFESPSLAAQEEIKGNPDQEENSTFLHESTNTPKKTTWSLNPELFSKWYRANPRNSIEIGRSLVRIRSWVHRFVENARKAKEERKRGELTPMELVKTETSIIRTAQQEAFPDEMKALKSGKPLPVKSPLIRHTPNLTEGVLRSNTRLRYSDELSEETKFPVILPKDHPVTKLIVKYHHEKEGHEMGINYTINHLRERYLVIHSRKQVKSCVSQCAECRRRFHKRTITQQMAPLPKIRLEKTMKPFTNTAVDYGGPYLTKQGRGKSRQKRYLCLFLCLQTHCCHLEMATSLETDGFINALVRMVARRGWPRDILSDNGTNFVGAAKEIRELVDKLDRDRIQRMTSNKGITWHWNPPAGPHFGGVFESMIKSAKRAIAAILGDAEVNDEELQTVFASVESLMNSRPLTNLSDDPNDDTVLTPNHFLIGQMGGELAPESVDQTSFNPRKRWRRVQELTRRVWQRWMKEYLPHIGSRHKWFLPTKNLKKDDVVLVIDPQSKRRDWGLGRIEATYPGQDGLVRVVDVRQNDKILRRPITRISPLEAYEYEDK